MTLIYVTDLQRNTLIFQKRIMIWQMNGGRIFVLFPKKNLRLLKELLQRTSLKRGIMNVMILLC